jgi:hypothetical protein
MAAAQAIQAALRAGTQASAVRAGGQEAAAWAAYSEQRARELGERRRLARVVDLLVDVPFLARRASSRLQRSAELRERLMAALGGAAPQSMRLPVLLARLVV